MIKPACDLQTVKTGKKSTLGFRQITSYLPEGFRQITSYLPEGFRQITSSLTLFILGGGRSAPKNENRESTFSGIG